MSQSNNSQLKPFSFASQRLTLSAIAWGDEANPLVILVHGGLDQKRSWDWTARALSDRYYVVAFDLRGHGESDWVNDGDYGVMDCVFDLASLVENLGREKFSLVCHSYGGNIVLRYAGLYPDRVEKLVSIEGLGPSPKMIAEREATPPYERMQKWLERRRSVSKRETRVMKDYGEALERMTKAHAHLRPDQLEHLTRTGIRMLADGNVRWAYDIAFNAPSSSDISREDFRSLLKRITCPTWMPYGEKSWASNPAEDGRLDWFADGVADVQVFAGAGHWLHHDSFDVFIGELSMFLEK